MATTIQSCPIILTNNTNNVLLVKLNNTKEAQDRIIRRGETITFGDKTQHANFSVYKELKPGSYDYQYTVKQHACAMGETIKLKANDMPYKMDRELFEVLYKR